MERIESLLLDTEGLGGQDWVPETLLLQAEGSDGQGWVSEALLLEAEAPRGQHRVPGVLLTGFLVAIPGGLSRIQCPEEMWWSWGLPRAPQFLQLGPTRGFWGAQRRAVRNHSCW